MTGEHSRQAPQKWLGDAVYGDGGNRTHVVFPTNRSLVQVQSPRLQDAEGKRGHSGTQSSQIPPVEPDSERQSGTTGHTGEGFSGTKSRRTVADSVTRIRRDGCKGLA